ncbi:Myb/SANT-like domain-containing protein [Cynara cardunculus var. scolymus]|uniref:Myb/SANT-like domain-containing protein n=1 Tax=Cynara cardunculus var. scolymus TaxID=59895 RepID=A0A103XYT3_CYNCS|nr:Myb/SANT-like domain-containing protein [Cynara cardunculus var. scolymus]
MYYSKMADRRNWNIQEEDVLISILQEIVAAGGRSDNGCFRTGTYEQIVLKMREKITSLNITSKHIQNKMKRLKDKYSAAYDMLNTSGFGWDDAHQCVTVDAQVLEEYLKPFPQYERLKTIFEKDRATGSMAESAADALEHINLESAVGDDTDELNVPLTTHSNGASASSIPQDVEAS